ncbi:MAG TPA: DnaA regulatory inactivator Hda [Rhodanobacteraceae bacterium]|nr:DnaA regulatory inactivator Hda [Rhodanobacteraceae bacterium]
MPRTEQLPLGLRWPAWQRFEHFEPGDNALALASCQRMAAGAEPWLLLSGPAGVGKTHLLLATCQQATSLGAVAQYLSLRALPPNRSAAIRGQGGSALVALDDLDAIVGDREAEHALFDLYNRCRADGARLLLATAAPLAALDLVLPDLASRLGAMTQLPLLGLDESARRMLTRKRAAARGIELDDSVLDWLFRNHARDLDSLAALIDQLDRATLAEHRRVTIPFLRQLLARASMRSS